VAATEFAAPPPGGYSPRPTPRRGPLPLPNALQLLPDLLAARTRAGHLFVGLDYDGTLTPIVSDPDAAHLPPATGRALARLAARPDTTVAILSGRALADVRRRVGVGGACYAGNHGLEIAGPGLERLHPDAAAARPLLREAAARLTRELVAIPGAQVEDKGATLSVHYRRVAPGAQAAVRDVALRIGQETPGVRCTEGKMVVELRPDVDWHKGSALRFLLAALPAGSGPAVYAGDDTTDEDAFRALAGESYGIRVAEQPGGTAARAWLASPAEVRSWLEGMAEG
jgi:trehalose 6-phosphate phosphatase